MLKFKGLSAGIAILFVLNASAGDCVDGLTASATSVHTGLDPIEAAAYLELTRELEGLGGMSAAEENLAMGEAQFSNLAQLGVFHTAVLKVLAANGAKTREEVSYYLKSVNTLTDRALDDLVLNVVATMIRDNDPEVEMGEIAGLASRLEESKTTAADYQAFHQRWREQIDVYFHPFEARVRALFKRQDPKFIAAVLEGRKTFLGMYRPIESEADLISRDYNSIVLRGAQSAFKDFFVGRYLNDLSLSQLESVLDRHSHHLKPKTKVQTYERLYELYTKALYESIAKSDQASARKILASLKMYFKQTGYARWDDFVKTYYSQFELAELRELVADPEWQRTQDTIQEEVERYLERKQVDQLGRELVRFNEETLYQVKARGDRALSGDALTRYFDRNIQLAAQLATKKQDDKVLDIMNRIFAELLGREKDHHRVDTGNRDHACLNCRTSAGAIWEVDKITEMVQLLRMEFEFKIEAKGFNEKVPENILQGMDVFVVGNFALADKYKAAPAAHYPSRKTVGLRTDEDLPHLYDALRNNIEAVKLLRSKLKSPRYQAPLTFFIIRLEAEISRGESGAYGFMTKELVVESLEISGGMMDALLNVFKAEK